MMQSLARRNPARCALIGRRTAPAERSNAFTVAEAIVATAIFSMLVAIALSLYAGGASGSARSMEASDALRSTLVAAEAIRRDVGEMLYQIRDRDVVISPDHRSLTIRVPASLPDDFWNADFEGIVLRLERVEGTSNTFQLVRHSRTGAQVISGCLLEDVQFEFIPAGGLSTLQAFLEVTLVGLSSEKTATRYTYSMFLPITRLKAPEPIKIPTGGL
jgi:type II secretory pathway pseudopilin PulG